MRRSWSGKEKEKSSQQREWHLGDYSTWPVLEAVWFGWSIESKGDVRTEARAHMDAT